MSFSKTIILVIIIAILIGAGIVFIPKLLNQSPTSTPTIKGTTTQNNSQPTPVPTQPSVIINESSNLKDEINKIKIPDFKPDFDQLKAELN